MYSETLNIVWKIINQNNIIIFVKYLSLQYTCMCFTSNELHWHLEIKESKNYELFLNNILQILVLQTMIYFIPVTVTCILMNSNFMDPVL